MPGYVYKGTRFDVGEEPPPPLNVFDPAKCGTTKGYRQHLRAGIPVCAECREANKAYDRIQGIKRRARKAAACSQ